MGSIQAGFKRSNALVSDAKVVWTATLIVRAASVGFSPSAKGSCRRSVSTKNR